jgi:hypothetical protein
MYPSIIFVSILINQVLGNSWASPTVSRHSGATWIMVKIHLTSSKVSLVFSKSLEVRGDYMPRTTKVLKAATLNRSDKHKEKSEQETIMSGLCEALIHLGSVVT